MAYIRYDDAQTLAGGRVWLYDMQMGRASAIGPELERLTGIAWSPDGHYLLLDVGTSINRSLSVFELSSGDVIEDLGSLGGYAWSLRGDAVAIGLRQPLTASLSLETGDSVSLAVKVVGQPEPMVLLEGDAETLYFVRAWLPDARILYARLDWDEAAQSGTSSWWTLAFDGEQLDAEPQLATDFPLPYQPEILDRVQSRISPTIFGVIAWSPDYRHSVVAAGPPSAPDLYRVDWNTATSHRLTSGVSPAWRPSPPSSTLLPSADVQPYIPDGVAPERILNGTVVEINGDMLVVEHEERGLITLHLNKNTRIWKGRWDNSQPIEVGDEFYGYGDSNADGTVYEMEQLEVNIVNIRGEVISVTETAMGLDVELDDVHTGRVLVHIKPETEVAEAGESVPFAESTFTLSPGDGLQLIGLRLKDGSVDAVQTF